MAASHPLLELDKKRVLSLIDAGVGGFELTKKRLDYGVIFFEESVALIPLESPALLYS